MCSYYRKGHYYRLEMEAPDDKGTSLPLSAEEIKLQLQQICADADGQSLGSIKWM